ncbi:hypothetical protein F2Q70_00031803 [Brassica cretica]|uniref:Uncharacterized protein n=1 Tax=Brassica cretica TaxID=69181 RepID=A0A8S9FL75_BRACR|nr:hypothetical protein F2Q70_00031803 [Brassica cretica]
MWSLQPYFARISILFVWVMLSKSSASCSRLSLNYRVPALGLTVALPFAASG